MKPKCQRVDFTAPDGVDKANVPKKQTFKQLPYSNLYTKEGIEAIQGLSTPRFEQVFGPGEDRPIEFNIWRVWRFKHNDTYLVVKIPRLHTHYPSILIEAPEGINESCTDAAVRQNVEEFIADLFSDLQQT